jgi:hypothetical protein
MTSSLRCAMAPVLQGTAQGRKAGYKQRSRLPRSRGQSGAQHIALMRLFHRREWRHPRRHENRDGLAQHAYRVEPIRG